MEKLLVKYADVILNTCLKVEKNQPLFISANVEVRDFVNILAEEAYKIGVKDVYFDLYDPSLKHLALKYLDVDDLKKMTFWNKEVWNEYAKKGAAFIMLASEMPGLMSDIDLEKLSEMSIYSLNTSKEFDDLREKLQVPWCIAAVPTETWAKKVFPDSQDPVKDLWNKILDICDIKNTDYTKKIKERINSLSKRCDKLNSYDFRKLKYESSNGTSFEIGLPDNHVWCSGKETLTNGKEILVNYPSFEVFTSPDYKSANGIVYASKPLSYQDNIIDGFWIRFKNGKALECKAKKGEQILKSLLSSCKNSNYLGEVALVDYSSKISKSGILFYETLFDENASCHIALGASFSECIKNGTKMTEKELLQNNLNQCLVHVDFMIGTEDLKITGITKENKEVKIFEKGNFTKEFK